MFNTIKGWGLASVGVSLSPLHSRQSIQPKFVEPRAHPNPGVVPALPTNPNHGARAPRLPLFPHTHGGGSLFPQKRATAPFERETASGMLARAQASGCRRAHAGLQTAWARLEDRIIPAMGAGSGTKLAMLALRHAVDGVAAEARAGAADVALALRRLQELDVLRQIGTASPIAAAFGDDGLVWRLIYRLGSSEQGLRVLEAICPSSSTATAGGQAADRQRWLVALMAAFDALAKERDRAGSASSWSPQALQQAIRHAARSRPLSLVERAIGALQWRLENLEAGEDAMPDHPDAWTVAAIENGFLTMESLREPAARLQKLATKWVERVLPKPSLATRFRVALQAGRLSWSLFSPLHKKSPFRALAFAGNGGAPDFGVADRSGLQTSRGMAAALEEVERSLTQAVENPASDSRPLLRPQLRSAFGPMARRLPGRAEVFRAAQLEIVRHWRCPEKMTMLGMAQSVPPSALPALEDRLFARMAPESSTGDVPDPNAQAAVKANVRDALARENRPMTPQRLIEMAHAIPGCDVGQVRRSLGDSRAPASPRASIYPLSRKGLTRALCGAVRGMDEGSRINLSGGGVIGAGLKGTSATLAGIFAGGVLGARLDARVERSRQALCEIGASDYGIELLAGAQTLRKKQIGIGMFAGANVGPMLLGGGIDISRTTESTSTDSVLLRLARAEDGSGGTQRHLVSFQEVVRCLLDEPSGGHANRTEEENNILVRLFKRFPDLSVGEKASSPVRNRLTSLKTSIVAGALFRHGLFRFGAGVACRAEQRRFLPYHYLEKSGRLRVERLTFGHLQRLNVSASVHAGSIPIDVPGIDGHPDGQSLSEGGGAASIRWTQNTPGLELAQWNADVYRHGHACRVTLVSDAGIVQRHSSCVRIHANAHQFARSVMTDLDRWAASLAERSDAGWHAQNGACREAAIRAARDRIQHFLGQTLREAEPAQAFHEHFVLRADVAQELSMLQEVARQAANERAAEPYRLAIQKRLESEASWVPASLRVHDATLDQRSLRMDLLAKIGSMHSKGSTRILAML